jgi:ribosomal protein S21
MAKNFGVKKRKHEDINKLLRRFKNLYQECEIKQEVVERRYYKKPTTIRRKQKQEAIRENERFVKWYKENN